MKMVVGLGNPGRKYQQTRHNVGFEVLAKVAWRHAVGPVTGRFEGELIDFQSDAGKVLLLCPLTYMNRSGQSVRVALDFYKLPLSDWLVVCDDFSLPLGRLRFRPHGSAGGQKGLADIIRRVGTDQFARLRVGIGLPPPQWDPADYVLARFGAEEREVMDQAVERAARGVDDWLQHGTEYCMNQYNGI
jgi:PTH1 family peptidyl-tRNA hydrolase